MLKSHKAAITTVVALYSLIQCYGHVDCFPFYEVVMIVEIAKKRDYNSYYAVTS